MSSHQKFPKQTKVKITSVWDDRKQTHAIILFVGKSKVTTKTICLMYKPNSRVFVKRFAHSTWHLKIKQEYNTTD